MTVLVIGRGGQLATELERAARRRALAMRTLGRSEADLEDPASLEAAIAGVPEARIVVNAAAYTAVDAAENDRGRAFAVNAEGPGVLAEATAKRGLPLVHISTDYVFDGTKPGPYVETDPTRPQGVYGASKLAGEEAVRAGNPSHLLIRTAWVYSAHGKNFVKTMLRLAGERDVLRVVDDQRGSPTSAGDLAEAVLAAVQTALDGDASPLWGTYHCAGAGETSWCGFARAIFEEAGAWAGHPRVEAITTEDFPTPAARPKNSVLDSSRFEAAFGTRPRPWRSALKDVLAELAPGAMPTKEAL